MIKEAIGTGPTIQAAIEEAHKLLAAPEGTDIQHEVLEMPQKKTFGIFGGSPAKVRAYYEIPDEIESKATVEKAEEKEEVKEQKEKEETKVKGIKALFSLGKKKAADAEKEEAAKEEAEAQSEDKVEKYLSDIIKGMGMGEFKISKSFNGVEYVYDIECEDSGALIGRRGETIDAIQYLLRLYANKNGGDNKRVSVNVGDYRKRRADSLTALAQRTARKVLRNGRSITLEPMNPYERRIVHTAVQTVEGVKSHSIGQDDNRRVVISLADGVKPTGGGKPRMKGKKGGKRPSGKRPAPPRQNRTENASAAEEHRAPIVDLSTAARYERIEIKKEAEM